MKVESKARLSSFRVEVDTVTDGVVTGEEATINRQRCGQYAPLAGQPFFADGLSEQRPRHSSTPRHLVLTLQSTCATKDTAEDFFFCNTALSKEAHCGRSRCNTMPTDLGFIRGELPRTTSPLKLWAFLQRGGGGGGCTVNGPD